jgi:hypothetical protein
MCTLKSPYQDSSAQRSSTPTGYKKDFFFLSFFMNCTRTAFNLSGSPVFPRKITIRSFTRLLIAYANAYSSSLVVRSVRTQSRVAQLALRNRPYIFIQFSVLFWVMATGHVAEAFASTLRFLSRLASSPWRLSPRQILETNRFITRP